MLPDAVWVAVASRAICLLGVRKNSLGATVLCLAAGFPDLLTAMILVKRPGMMGMAASNPFGAFLYNGLVALGIPWLILGTYADVFPPAKGTWYPSLVGFVCIFIALTALLAVRMKLSKGLGYFLLSLYVGYLTAIIYDGTTRPARPPAPALLPDRDLAMRLGHAVRPRDASRLLRRVHC